MIPSEVSLGFLSLGVYPIFAVFVFFLSAFLFWRAGRHELVESDLLFDFILISFAGALLFGRIFDFLIRADFYQWSAQRLIFFNIYGGLDFYGAILGAILVGTIYLKRKKVNPWHIFDLSAMPLVLAQSLSSLLLFLMGQIPTREFNLPWELVINSLSLPILPLTFYYFVAYLMIFWVLKRLATQKRHIGFFACFYLMFVPLVDLLFSLIDEGRIPTGSRLWQDSVDLVFIIFGAVSWYILAKKNPITDFKSALGLALLGIFRFRRIITSAEEAGKFSKTLLFIPLYLLRLLLTVVKLVCFQVILGFVDFIKVFKSRR